jgi:hypothetical protein
MGARRISNFGAFGITPVNCGDGQICCAAFSDWLSTTNSAIVDIFLILIVDILQLCLWTLLQCVGIHCISNETIKRVLRYTVK